jgi:hypothetical protein
MFKIMDVDNAKDPLNGGAQEIGHVEATMSKVLMIVRICHKIHGTIHEIELTYQQIELTYQHLAQLVGSPNGKFESVLIGKGGKNGFGRLIVITEELKGREGDTLNLTMYGVQLAAKDASIANAYTGKSDPYLKFIAHRKDGVDIEIVHTETIPQNLNPHWKPFQVDMDKLCNGDLDTPFKIECWDEDSMSSHDMIGWIDTTIRALLTKQPLVLNDRCVCINEYTNKYLQMSM